MFRRKGRLARPFPFPTPDIGSIRYSRRMRPILLALLLAAAAPSYAKDSPKDERQFIDRSNITVPREVGRYTYDNGDYDPAQWAAGASAHYNFPGEPECLVISVYVYPKGRSTEAEAVAQQAQQVEDAIRQPDSYSMVEAGPRTSFTVDAPARTAEAIAKGPKQQVVFRGPAPKEVEAPVPTAEGAKGEDGVSDALLQAIAGMSPPKSSVGSRQAFHFVREGVAMRSAGLVFYRALFNIKLRISAPSDSVSQTDFDAIVDDAARTIVPAIDIRNFGRCGDMVIEMPETIPKGDNGETLAGKLVAEQGRVLRENCAGLEGKDDREVPKDHVRHTIVYPPGTWN
jgi:hypothetical protein